MPLLMSSPFKLASFDCLLTFIVYVFTVVVSSAVTSTVISLSPTFRSIPSDAEPLANAFPFTVTLASLCAVVGVTVSVVTAFATDTSYSVSPDANAVSNDPSLTVKLLKSAFDDKGDTISLILKDCKVTLEIASPPILVIVTANAAISFMLFKLIVYFCWLSPFIVLNSSVDPIGFPPASNPVISILNWC